jgi:hypothetical protein
VSRQRVLDTFGDPEFVVRFMEPDGAAADGVDRRHDLFARGEIRVIDPLHALQAAIGAQDRRDDGREVAD